MRDDRARCSPAPSWRRWRSRRRSSPTSRDRSSGSDASSRRAAAAQAAAPDDRRGHRRVAARSRAAARSDALGRQRVRLRADRRGRSRGGDHAADRAAPRDRRVRPDVRVRRREGRRRHDDGRGERGDGAGEAAGKRKSTLLIDLHVANGDAAVFLGAEPRFSIVDALENTHRLDEVVLSRPDRQDEVRRRPAGVVGPRDGGARSTSGGFGRCSSSPRGTTGTSSWTCRARTRRCWTRSKA